MPRAQHQIRLALLNMPLLLKAPCPPPAHTRCHLIASSLPPGQPFRGRGCCTGLALGLGAPLPLHSTSSPVKLFFFPAPCYLLPTHPLYSHVLCHFVKCSWDYLGTAPTQCFFALQHHNLSFIKLNLTQQRTAKENIKMFPLKCMVSELCTAYHNQCFFNEKAILPSKTFVQ